MIIPDYTFVIHSFVALFLIIEPFGLVPVFISLLEDFREKDKLKMIRMAIIIATVVLLVLTVSGNLIFQILRINMYSFKIAGGILLLIISIEMLFGKKTRSRPTSEELDDMEADMERKDIAIAPMAVPLLTGPGAITTGIVLFDSAGTLENRIFLIINILLVFAVSYTILSKSVSIYNTLGKTGTRIIARVMGLMLSSISVEFIISGISEAIASGGMF